MKKIAAFSDSWTGLALKIDTLQTKSSGSTENSSKNNLTSIPSLKSSWTSSKVKIKKLVSEEKDSYKESFKNSRKLKFIDKNKVSLKGWKKESKEPESSYGFVQSPTSTILNSPLHKSDNKMSIPQSIIKLMGK